MWSSQPFTLIFILFIREHSSQWNLKVFPVVLCVHTIKPGQKPMTAGVESSTSTIMSTQYCGLAKMCAESRPPRGLTIGFLTSLPRTELPFSLVPFGCTRCRVKLGFRTCKTIQRRQCELLEKQYQSYIATGLDSKLLQERAWRGNPWGKENLGEPQDWVGKFWKEE